MESLAFRSKLRVESVLVYNLWGKKEISIPINDCVTILTGINGSGKSSLLNVIFDSLILDPRRLKRPSTSKNRFWSSKCVFSNKYHLDTIILPYIDASINLEDVDRILNDDFANQETVESIQKHFCQSKFGENLTYVAYDSEPKGEIWRKKGTMHKNGSIVNVDELFHDQEPLAFIFQEDRVSLHSRNENENEKNRFYKTVYRSSIDERFEYIRDAIQVRESFNFKNVADSLSTIPLDKISFNDMLEFEPYKEARLQIKNIENVVEILNKYFSTSGKIVIRDNDNKYTLAFLHDDSKAPISWNLLSRGEKTIFYLFFAVYYYKEKVNVFLLDEPDVSLHVSWQENLIKDLVSIAPSKQFIIATHSPSLVMNGWLSNCLDIKV